jgi:hypothetical protein
MPRKSSPRKSPAQRKGAVINMSGVPASVQQKVDAQAAKHGGLSELRGYDNGAVGAFFNDGQFRFVKGADNIKSISRSPKRKSYSPRGAKSVMSRYYNKKSYKSKGRKAAAMKRDMCTQNKPSHVVSDSRWARNPRKYDLEGFDDGSQCDGPVLKYKKRAASPKQAAALAAGRAKRGQRGGAKPVSLKTAVSLLRQYYAEKYN